MTPTPKPARADLAPEARCAVCGNALSDTEAYWYTNLCEAHADGYSGEQAALARRPAPDLLALAAKWRAEADAICSERKANASAPGQLWHGERQGREQALRDKAAELEALAAERARDD